MPNNVVQYIRCALSTALLAGLTACGGGGGSPGAPFNSGTVEPTTTTVVDTSTQATPTSIELVSYDPADRSILVKGNVAAGRSQTALVTFKVTGSNQPVANQKVKFEFQPADTDLTFDSDTATTNTNGEVTAIVYSGATVTVAAVKATVLDANNQPTAISGTSLNITVTNDSTSAAGISLAATKFYVEALNRDGETSTITARLTDKQGGQVTDGTAVTFTTDGGAITGENNSAKCTTVDGACSVTFVGQNPRPASGIATIIAATFVDGAIVETPIQLAMSGSFAEIFGPNPIDATIDCSKRSFDYILSDVNGNNLPEGSTLSVATSSNVTATALGATSTVKYNYALSGGTTHVVEVALPTSCVASGPTAATGSFRLLLVTPAGAQTLSAPITVNYRTN